MQLSIPFGVHIIRFDGGLGNQMFEYAFYLTLKRRMPFRIYGFDIEGSEGQHYGFELDRIFNIDTSWQRRILPMLRKLERHNYLKLSKLEEKSPWTYESNLLQGRIRPTEYIGYWQTERYFCKIEKIVRKAFRFRQELLNDKTKSLADWLSMNENTISLHVRRGDYVDNDNVKTFGPSYFNEAVKCVRMRTGGGKLIVFSDEIMWCKENLQIESAIYVDWNSGTDSWQDMYLMSLCKHNIIVNSSFSWWGAWLNENPNKIVIAPKIWMNSDSGKDIIPENWIRI